MNYEDWLKSELSSDEHTRFYDVFHIICAICGVAARPDIVRVHVHTSPTGEIVTNLTLAGVCPCCKGVLMENTVQL